LAASAAFLALDGTDARAPAAVKHHVGDDQAAAGLQADIRWLRQNKNASCTFPNAVAEFT
jgi:hypothetical protein